MKKWLILHFVLLVSFTNWGQSDFGLDEPDTSTAKVGHRFYFKAEVLNTFAKLFIPNTYHFDVQVTTRIANKFHWVNTIGQTTLYKLDSAESFTLPGVFQSFEAQGIARYTISSMIRYYPFYNISAGIDHLFIEGGMYLQRYSGTSISKIHDNYLNITEEHSTQKLEMIRRGPQLNIGLSYFFEEKDIHSPQNKKKILFSPEILFGINYTDTKILSNDVEHLIGNSTNFENYEDKKFHYQIRIKLGIGIF